MGVLAIKNRITHIVKRSGKRVLFNEGKIVQAVWKAMQAEGEGTLSDAERVMELVIRKLNEDFPDKVPSVEDVQDRVEQALIELKYSATAKGYILYRNERAKLREQKAALIGGQVDDLKLSFNAVKLLEKRYLRKEDGEIAETPSQLFWRVAKTVAMAELQHGGEPKNAARTYYRLLSTLEFLPSSPTLMNAGLKEKQLNSCFVVPIEDDLRSIFHSLEQAAVIQQSGGGTGFSFSRIRPRNDTSGGMPSAAAGPIAFMRVFEAGMHAVKQGGIRQGANMAVLRVDHPDILDFINLKLTGKMQNFNLSVGITDAFMRALERNEEYDLVNPRTNEVTNQLSARVVFDSILAVSWRCGDPGLLFLDRINEANVVPHLGEIEATNPCAEQPLLPYESCCEGSINLTECVKDNSVDFEKLKRITRTAVRFLDNVVDVNPYPIPEAEKVSRRTRRIGLGVMGFADLLFLLEIPYASQDAVELANTLSKTIREAAEEASTELARERGPFSACRRSTLDKERRNSGLLGIAPTGSISIIANVSSGIEPNYALAYSRTLAGGETMPILNEAFKEVMQRHNISEDVVQEIAKRGQVQDELPDSLRDVLVTAQQVPPEWHIRIQAAWQRHVDGAISKTINYPAQASVKQVEEGMLLAYRLGCKGITVYRDSSLDVQALTAGGP